jgi:hypothetical protein
VALAQNKTKKFSVANKTGTKNATVNQTQQLKCQRRTPAHRQQDFFGCIDETQGKEK